MKRILDFTRCAICIDMICKILHALVDVFFHHFDLSGHAHSNQKEPSMISIYTIIGFSLVMSLAHGMQKVVSARTENERSDFVNGAQNNLSLGARAAEEPSSSCFKFA